MAYITKRSITVSTIVLYNLSLLANLRSVPLIATYGYQAVPFFFLAAIFFVFPVTFVTAELSTGWPKSGGIYIWVKEALGQKWGFFSVWMQWIHHLPLFSALLTFVASTIAYAFFPQLIENKIYIALMVIALFWGITLLNLLNIKSSTTFISFGVIFGALLPFLLLIGFGIYSLLSPSPQQITFSFENFLPKIKKLNDLSFLSGILLAFAGIEISAGYASEVKNPQKNYPKAIIISAVIGFTLLLFASLSVAFVIPHGKIDLVTGLIQTFSHFLNLFNISWLFPILCLLISLGTIAELNSQFIGPIKALQVTGEEGILPPFLQQVNKNNSPTNILIIQGAFVTITSLLFILVPNISGSFWIFTVLAVQMYLLMYLVMFISAIILRYTHGHIPRLYKIKSPHKGIWLPCVLGIIGCLFCLTISFIPPSHFKITNPSYYAGFLALILVITSSIPFIICRAKKKSWHPTYRCLKEHDSIKVEETL